MSALAGPVHLPRAGGRPGRVVVLLHGLGADGHDLIALAPDLARHLPDAVFHAPNAPERCDLAPLGRQWFSVADLVAGELPDWSKIPAERVARAAAQLGAYLDELLARHDLPASRLGIVGFSQGAMLALHLAPRREPCIGAVVGYSGALVAPERLAVEARCRPPVLLVHGDADEIVPAACMFEAFGALQQAGFPVQWLLRPGLAHGVDPIGLEAGGRFLRDHLV